MSTWQPPWSAPGQFKLTLLPPTRASNSVTARRPPGPGSSAALRTGSRDPGTLRPARRSRLAGGGCQTDSVPVKPPLGAHECSLAPSAPGLTAPGSARQPTTRQPRRPERFGPRPASPAATVSTSTTRAEDSGRRRPTRRDHSEPDRRIWRGRAAFALLGWGNNPSMVMLRRTGRRRAAGAGPMVRAFGDTRTCAEDGCTAQLSRYNPARRCAIHQGWDRQKVTRPRIRQQGHGRG
jgi:hypothetical protein